MNKELELAIDRALEQAFGNGYQAALSDFNIKVDDHV